MRRSRRLEVADVFHRHGADWRRANAGHVSLGQLQVMSAIEQCRSAALVGLQPTGLMGWMAPERHLCAKLGMQLQ